MPSTRAYAAQCLTRDSEGQITLGLRIEMQSANEARAMAEAVVLTVRGAVALRLVSDEDGRVRTFSLLAEVGAVPDYRRLAALLLPGEDEGG